MSRAAQQQMCSVLTHNLIVILVLILPGRICPQTAHFLLKKNLFVSASGFRHVASPPRLQNGRFSWSESNRLPLDKVFADYQLVLSKHWVITAQSTAWNVARHNWSHADGHMSTNTLMQLGVHLHRCHTNKANTLLTPTFTKTHFWLSCKYFDTLHAKLDIISINNTLLMHKRATCCPDW